MTTGVFVIGNDIPDEYDFLEGTDNDDTLVGLAGTDDLYGGLGADVLMGGMGSDYYYVDSALDVVIEESNDPDPYSTDTVISTISYTLGDHVESLYLEWGAALALNAIGNALDNSITGNELDNLIDGQDGNDYLDGGGLGNDTILGGNGNDVLSGYAEIGSTSHALLIGGAGDDLYYVSNLINNQIIETADGGLDRVITWENQLTAPENVEDAQLFGDSINSTTLTGNGLDNHLWTYSSNDLLLGGSGNDTLNSGSGQDTLDGGEGFDVLEGGDGNDTYILTDAGDVVHELAGDGFDTLITSHSLTLPSNSNIEKVVLQGNAPISATGNELVDLLVGNASANTLSGMAGNDVLLGQSGNDTLLGGQGTDQLFGDHTIVVRAKALSPSVYGELPIMELFVNKMPYGQMQTISSGNFIDYYYSVDLPNSNNLGIDVYFLNADSGMRLQVESVTVQGQTLLPSDGMRDIYELDGSSQTLSSTGYMQYREGLRFGGGLKLNGVPLKAVPTTATLAGDDVLDGGEGADLLSGGSGNDSYVVDNVGDLVIESVNGGTDTVYSSVTWAMVGPGLLQRTSTLATGYSLDTVSDQIEALYLVAGAGAINGTGSTIGNLIVGNESANVIDGREGVDTLMGGGGNDIYWVDRSEDRVIEQAAEGWDVVHATASYILGSEVEELVLDGDTAINATGNEMSNVLTGNRYDNRLDGGLGVDTLRGGEGNDTYVLDTLADVIEEVADLDGSYQSHRGGIDTVITSFDYTLPALLENLQLQGSAIQAEGNAADNVLTGNALNNVLIGHEGSDQLDGGAGLDTLIGGTGDDLYTIDRLADSIVESLGEGTDTVMFNTSVNFREYSLANGLENIQIVDDLLKGTKDAAGNTLPDYTIVARGNEADNLIIGHALDSRYYYSVGYRTAEMWGNGGNDTLMAGVSNDVLRGGTGNDTYVLNAPWKQTIIENADEGIDSVYVNDMQTYTLPNQVENGYQTSRYDARYPTYTLIGNGLDNQLHGGMLNDSLAGMAGKDTLLGGFGLDSLTGGTEADWLDGGSGADKMWGNAGDDVYVVDNQADVVTEVAGEGHDRVESSVSYTLSAELEALTLTGSARINGFGNSLANSLKGNGSANLLDGGAGDDLLDAGLGNDTLKGGLGNDTLTGGLGQDVYWIDSTGDVIIEAIGGGTDTVYLEGFVQYSLQGTQIENAMASGANAGLGVTLMGNDMANVLGGSLLADALSGGSGNDTLRGNAGDDQLNGGQGNDLMDGGAGNDRYVVDNAGDVINELAGDGTDTVELSGFIGSAYTLGANVENLILTGSAAITAMGNALANALTGNSGNNIMDGSGGNDTLRGGLGADTLTASSSTSNDTYIWGLGEGADVLTDVGGVDTLSVLAGVTADQIWLNRAASTNSLVISVIGTTDSFTVKDWYAASAHQVESIQLADGRSLASANVQNLVNAMAAFVAPAIGQTTLPANHQSALNSVIAANWA